MNRNQRVVILFGLLLISAIVLGCASNSRIETAASYEAELERAQASVTEAEQAGAAEFGGPRLALARERLRGAERAAEEGNGERARRLALEAELDADLAVAIKNNRDTQPLVTEIRSSLRTLDDELRRGDSSDRSAR